MQLYTTDADREFYSAVVRPLLPERVLDFHTHVWKPDHWLGGQSPSPTAPRASTDVSAAPGAKYMATELDVGIEKLQECAQGIFPGVEYHAVVFGQPTPTADTDRTNDYAGRCGKTGNFYPLMIPRPGQRSPSQLTDALAAGGFCGFKVFLNWMGDAYADVAVEDMITDVEMRVADELGLIVLLHVPGAERLAAKGVQESVRRYSREYPNARIVLAHCGRCYDQDTMARAADFLVGLENVYMDSSMVMEAGVIKLVLDAIGPGRLLFATDFPVAIMKGRRVHVMDHWADVVTEGYPESDYRVASSNMHATYMAYEIILAVVRGARLAGISDGDLAGVFFNNGIELIRSAAVSMDRAR